VRLSPERCPSIHEGLIQTIFFLTLLWGLVPGALHAGEQSAGRPDRHDLVFMPASRLAELIRTGVTTSSEVVDAYLEQIKLHNPKLNAIVTLDEAGARRQARLADEALAKGIIWGPLHGVPVTVKDNFAAKGLKTTDSVADREGYVPSYDATVVKRIRDAGALILGKTNLPERAMDTQTRSPLFGVTSNPWDLGRTPGGSSGGEAAAVAAGLSALGLGNDIGGSIRIPSHFCGIYGMKPTENLTSTYGISPGPGGSELRTVRHMACSGPMARSVEDLRLALSIIAGPDLRNPDIPRVDLTAGPAKGLKELRIAWTDDFGGVPVTKETKDAIRSLAKRLSQLGCTVEKIESSPFAPHVASMAPEVKDLYGITRSDPATYTYQSAWKTYGELMDLELGVHQPWFFRLFSYVFGAWYRSDVPMIAMVFPQSYEKYLSTLTRRDVFVNAFDSFLSERDAMLCPVSCTEAFEHIEPWRHFGPYPVYTAPVMVDGRPVKYLVANLSYTSIFNLTGNPVVVIPVGYTAQGLPIGIQIVGKRWRDWDLLSVAQKIDEAAGAYRRPKGY